MGSHPTLHTSPASILNAARTLINAGPTDIAVAFWGRGAVAELELGAAHAGTRIVLNADSGACNPTELRALKALKGIQVKNCPRLHAKIAIGRDQMLVGSANFSSNGLGFQGKELTGWHEACISISETKPVQEAKKWFEALWVAPDAEVLDEKVIKRAELAMAALRRGVLAKLASQPAGTTAIDSWEGAPIYVVLSDEETTDKDENSFKVSIEKLGFSSSAVGFYEDWPQMPKNSLLFHYDAEAGVPNCAFGGAWDTTGWHRTVALPSGGKAYPVNKANKDSLRQYGMPTDRLNWKQAVNAVIRVIGNKSVRRALKAKPGVQVSSPTAWCIPLAEFLTLCDEHNIPRPKVLEGGTT